MNIFQNSKWKQEQAIEIKNRFGILENIEDKDNMDNNINEKGGEKNYKNNEGNKTTAVWKHRNIKKQAV